MSELVITVELRTIKGKIDEESGEEYCRWKLFLKSTIPENLVNCIQRIEYGPLHESFDIKPDHKINVFDPPYAMELESFLSVDFPATVFFKDGSIKTVLLDVELLKEEEGPSYDTNYELDFTKMELDILLARFGHVANLNTNSAASRMRKSSSYIAPSSKKKQMKKEPFIQESDVKIPKKILGLEDQLFNPLSQEPVRKESLKRSRESTEEPDTSGQISKDSKSMSDPPKKRQNNADIEDLKKDELPRTAKRRESNPRKIEPEPIQLPSFKKKPRDSREMKSSIDKTEVKTKNTLPSFKKKPISESISNEKEAGEIDSFEVVKAKVIEKNRPIDKGSKSSDRNPSNFKDLRNSNENSRKRTVSNQSDTNDKSVKIRQNNSLAESLFDKVDLRKTPAKPAPSKNGPYNLTKNVSEAKGTVKSAILKPEVSTSMSSSTSKPLQKTDKQLSLSELLDRIPDPSEALKLQKRIEKDPLPSKDLLFDRLLKLVKSGNSAKMLEVATFINEYSSVRSDFKITRSQEPPIFQFNVDSFDEHLCRGVHGILLRR